MINKKYPLLFAENNQDQLQERKEKAISEAKRLAKILKQDFGAEKVYLFGSLARPDGFHTRSDIDLAVQGLSPRKYYRAVSFLLDEAQDFQVDLIDLEECRETIRLRILEEGVEL